MPYLFLFREKRCDEIGWSGIVYRISVRAKCKYRRKAVCFGQRGEVKRRLEFKLDGNLTYACNDGRFTRSRLFLFANVPKKNARLSEKSDRWAFVIISICSTPVYHVVCFLATANAGFRDILLLKWEAAAGRGHFLFDCVLACTFTAPHCFYKAGCFV